MKKLKRISKLMSYILRHKPEHINVELDENGWLEVEKLIEGINREERIALDKKTLEEVVRTNDKKRFVLSADGLKIRANQGHSVRVDLELKEVEPPEFLYHGTVGKFMKSIREEGLMKMNRQHVHLSKDKETAINVGGRRGKPVVLIVQSGIMHRDGIKFFRSQNGVWLTDFVNPKYLIE
ncbi:MAG: RNA 2'-phosphotransferase [Roseivirga sp.]|nr:RNA 2'-phosphotransferase [Roseivirga sp.]